jgi:hypothetical protein
VPSIEPPVDGKARSIRILGTGRVLLRPPAVALLFELPR